MHQAVPLPFSNGLSADRPPLNPYAKVRCKEGVRTASSASNSRLEFHRDLQYNDTHSTLGGYDDFAVGIAKKAGLYEASPDGLRRFAQTYPRQTRN